jgi:hypothetical protein
MRPPRPEALRLIGPVRGGRAPTPPMGLRAWTADAHSVCVVLDATGVDLEDPSEVARQLPHSTELAAGSVLFVLGAAQRGRGVLRWLGMRTLPVGRAARCTALVARGYSDVGASADPSTKADIAWGISSLC